MGRVVMLSDEVYERLRRMKSPGKSFSAVISRLLKYKPRLTEIAGGRMVTVKDWEHVEEAFRERDKLDDARRRYLLGLIDK